MVSLEQLRYSFTLFKEGIGVGDLAQSLCFLESGCHYTAQAVLEFAM